jgi:hypothetical protein
MNAPMNVRLGSLRAALLAACAAVLLLGGCASVTPEDYRDNKPVLELDRYFNGTIDGWGMVQERSGKAVRRFHVVIEAKWNGATGTLDESFDWSDGVKEKRIWTITKGADGRYTGTAADVVGEARGQARGNALQWNYVLRLPLDGKVVEVDMDDWMYLVDEDTLLNRTVLSKFGFRAAEISIAFRRRK